MVVDVLTFTTTVTVALELGIQVWPYGGDVASAGALAAERDATLAVSRSQARDGGISLSPASLGAARGVARLVLPSPNGSTIAAALAGRGADVMAASLRNASAVASWLDEHYGGGVVAVVAAGERWPGGGLRPAVEDLWGAGAVITALRDLGWRNGSPEADVAADAYGSARPTLAEALRRCASGRELVDAGHGDDVEVAATIDATDLAAHLADGCFVPVSAARPPPAARPAQGR